MIQIKFNNKPVSSSSFKSDFEKTIYKAAQESFQKQIAEKIKRIPGLANERITVTVDLKNNNVSVSGMSSEEVKEKIMKAIKWVQACISQILLPK